MNCKPDKSTCYKHSPNRQLTKQATSGRIPLEPLAHSVEHRPFKASVLGSKPRRLTILQAISKEFPPQPIDFLLQICCNELLKEYEVV